MCNCIKDVEHKMQERMQNEVGKLKGETRITDKAEFTTKGIYFGNAAKLSPIFLYLQVEGKYLKGKRLTKWLANLTFDYCPFCGEKLIGKEVGKDGK